VGDKQFVVHYEKDGEKLTMQCGMVLFGTGRKPNTDRLNLDVRVAHAAFVSRALRAATQKSGPHARLCSLSPDEADFDAASCFPSVRRVAGTITHELVSAYLRCITQQIRWCAPLPLRRQWASSSTRRALSWWTNTLTPTWTASGRSG